jgi:small-conductance mechanosensitive channel
MKEDLILQLNEISVWLWPAIIFGSALVLGFVIEKTLIPLLHRIAAKTAWKGDDIIIDSFKSMVMIWFGLAGIWFATLDVNIHPDMINLIRKVALVLAIFTATIVGSRIVTGLVKLQTEKMGGMIASTSLFYNITRIVVFIIGFLIILQSLGISITPLLTALGVGGLAVALALQDTLSNLFAGIQITATRKVQPGDFIRLDSGDEGFVTDITWRYTTIRTQPNNLVVVPNSKLANSIFTNYYSPDKEITFGVAMNIAYGNDLEKVEQFAIEEATRILQEDEKGAKDFEPVVRFLTFEESGVRFSVYLRVTDFDSQPLVRHMFIKALKARFDAEGIKLAYPVREIVSRGV